MPQPHPLPTPLLLSLPPEVRVQIFDYVFANSSISIRASVLAGVTIEHWSVASSILFTSRQLRCEAFPRLTVQLTISLPPRYYDGLIRQYTDTISKKLCARLRGCVTSLTLAGGVIRGCLHPIELFPNLRSLLFHRELPLTPLGEGYGSLVAVPTIKFPASSLPFPGTVELKMEFPVLARRLLRDLILRYNTDLISNDLQVYFQHTQAYVFDYGAFRARPVFEFYYDQGSKVLRGLHVVDGGQMGEWNGVGCVGVAEEGDCVLCVKDVTVVPPSDGRQYNFEESGDGLVEELFGSMA